VRRKIYHGRRAREGLVGMRGTMPESRGFLHLHFTERENLVTNTTWRNTKMKESALLDGEEEQGGGEGGKVRGNAD